MIESRWVILGMVLPALLAAATLSLILIPRRQSLTPRTVTLAWSAAVALGWILAYWATGGIPSKPWNTGENWLLPLGLAATLLATLPQSVKLQLIGRFVLFVGIGVAMLQPAIQHVWPWWQTVAWVSATAVITWGLTEFTDALGRRRAGHEMPLAMTITAAATGLVTLMTDSLLVGQFGFALAAVILGPTLAGLWLPRHLVAHGVAAIAMPLIATVLLLGTHSSDLHLRYALTTLAAPPLMWIADLPLFGRRRPWQIAAIRLCAVVIPLIIMFAMVTPQFLQELRDSGY